MKNESKTLNYTGFLEISKMKNSIKTTMGLTQNKFENPHLSYIFRRFNIEGYFTGEK